jgi:hypothetical protein
MKKRLLIPLSTKLAALLAIFCLSTLNLNAETWKDTLVNKPWRDTVRMVKAQVFDLDMNSTAIYYRPKAFQFAKNVPSDLYQLGKTTFSKRNLPKFAAIIAGTAAMTLVDQQITDAAQQFGRCINLSPAHEFHRVEVFNIPVIDLPGNLNAAFYFLGEGWPSIMIAGGFYGYGLMSHDYRALQTTSQLAEMFFTLAITTQFVKRITGRQSPFRAMDPPPGTTAVPGGSWHFLISPKNYQKSVSNHDAFPSGHLATAMATVTILAGNYPDNKYIKPVGYTLMGLLGYSMLNNGVHWLSDYPLAIAIGYTCGKIALARGRQVVPKIGSDRGSFSSLTPAYLGEGGIGLSYRATF